MISKLINDKNNNWYSFYFSRDFTKVMKPDVFWYESLLEIDSILFL